MIYSSRLSIKRIILSLAIFCITPGIAWVVNMLINNQTLAYMFSLNLCGTILIIYDWNLFGIHYNRSKSNMNNAIFYSIVGIILFSLLLALNKFIFHLNLLEPDISTTKSYIFALPAILIAYSFMHSILINIGFKCLTDHMRIHSKELLIILVSGALFGLIYTVVFSFYLNIGFNFINLISHYLFNAITVCICSYLYNQSGSFFPSMISLGLVYLLFIVSSIL